MILIIDFGSQYNQLIARRVREFHVYCQIDPPNIDIDHIKQLNPRGIILSGGPSGIYEKTVQNAMKPFLISGFLFLESAMACSL